MLDDFEEADIADIALFISSERLAAFRGIAGNERDAITLHQRVLAVGAGLAPILAIIEIALRNTVCENLRTAFGVPGWLQAPPTPFAWGSEEKSKIKEAERHAQRASYGKLTNVEKRDLDAVAYPNGVPANAKHETRVKARQKTIQVASGQVVAQLTLYFWKRLFSADYEETLWKRSLRQIFPNKRLERADVSEHLEVLYQARNRVAHHEPIYDARLDEVLASIDFVCRNFRSRRPSDDTALCKLLGSHRRTLADQVDTLRATLASFRTLPETRSTVASQTDQLGPGCLWCRLSWIRLMPDNAFMNALSAIEKTEANLSKVERVWDELQTLLPSGLFSGETPEYDEKGRSLELLLSGLPPIEGWQPMLHAPDPDAVSQNRLDLMELGEPSMEAQFESSLWADGRQLRDYRSKLGRVRRKIIRDKLIETMEEIERNIAGLRAESAHVEHFDRISSPRWTVLAELAKQMDVMLGDTLFPPQKWGYFKRHVHFACRNDLEDIEKQDWPFVRRNIEAVLYADDEPVPVAVADLTDLISARPTGSVVTALQWSTLDATQFERLIYTLVKGATGYENAEWLMHTNAPDKGRDLSAWRVQGDSLSGTDRKRVVIQCKHWTTKAVSQPDAYAAMGQTAMWRDPRVDVLVIATSGRFSSDAVQWIEGHNASSGIPKIEMWPESHLEALLSARPIIVAEFGLR